MTAKSKLLRMDNAPALSRAELVSELVQYEDTYRLAYLRGPEGIIVGLAEELRNSSATDALGTT